MDELRRGLEKVELEPDARERLRGRLDNHLRAAMATATPTARRTHRRRRPSMRIVVPAAAAVVLAVALSPWDRGANDRRPILAMSPAQAALTQAADAAGAVDARPLQPGEYHHVFSSSIGTKLVPNPDAPRIMGRNIEEDVLSRSFGGPNGASSWENWTGRAGSGRTILVDGRAVVKRPGTHVVTPALGGVLGTTVFTRPEGDGPELQQGWDLRDGIPKPTYHLDMSLGDPQPTVSQEELRWGLPLDVIEQLNGTSIDDVDDAVEAALRRNEDMQYELYGHIPNGVLGITYESRRREGRIGRAVGLLGGAPIAGHVRQALFEWLATQPGAQLDRRAIDSAGRRGTRVTFERIFDEQVAARTVTTNELVDEARAAGEEFVDETIDRSMFVPKHREYRRWRVDLIFDVRRGELLQGQSVVIENVDSLRYVPRLHRVTSSNGTVVRVDKNLVRNGASISSGGQLYWSRGRTTSIEPETPICRKYPRACRDSGGPLTDPSVQYR